MLKSRLKKILSNYILDDIVKVSVDKVFSEVIPVIREETSKLPKDPQITKIKIGPSIKTVEGVLHETFPIVLQLVNSDIPVYLAGEAGSGKNVICKQVAEALRLEFYFTNAVTQEYKLTGFIDANGHYHETQFYKAFKNGGLFFLDELDASIPEVLIILNAAIANRYFDFPIGKVEAHKNFRLIAAGNTFGSGADSVYSGRFCLDGASLDRFSIIPIHYSYAIEESITNKDKELLEFCYAYRKVTKDSGIQSIFSYRSLLSITRLKDTLPLPEILRICLVKGMPEDDLKSLKTNISSFISSKNRYLNALMKI